jgi:hypothetical protein
VSGNAPRLLKKSARSGPGPVVTNVNPGSVARRD